MASFLQEAINLTENAKTVLAKRYLKKDDSGNPSETPEQLFWRVASKIAEADIHQGKDEKTVKKLSEDFYKLMTTFSFMPNSPTLMNAGTELGQLSACFVLPIEDSLEGIFETIKNTAIIHKSGGGTGFSFSRLRPKNDFVRSTMGVSSGPVSFMEVFNSATEAVKQGGTRRGANMAILRVDHPDIIDFIDAKYDNDRLNNFNISVGLTSAFMDAVINKTTYDLVHPRTKTIHAQLDANEIFNKIVDHAWRNGEPGIVFLDTINKYNPTPHIGDIESTNPCGEVPLLPYEACNLGSINLSKMVKTNNEGQLEVDWVNLAEVTKLSVHFLDNVITMNSFPLPEIEQMARNNRKVGLGIMGWADLLMMLEIPYNSEEGIVLASQIMEFIDYHSKVKSIELAKERGRFPNFEGSVYESGDFLYEKYKGKSAGMINDEMWLDLDKEIQKSGLRNATTTCIAPTGTISIIAGASGGVEPIFSLVFLRNIMDGTEMIEVNPIFERVFKERGIYSDEIMREISEHGTVVGVEGVPEDIQNVFVTSHDISPEWHVKMQAAFQLHTDNAVSKTVNFIETATREQIAETYLLAYKSALKGITVYRNNSRFNQTMVVPSSKSKEEQTAVDNKIVTPRERPNLTVGITDKIQTGCGPLYITINVDEEGLCEVFARMGKSGGCATSQAEATGRMISLALRAGVDIDSIIEQLKGIRCPAPAFGKGGATLSCSDAIAKVLERNLDKVMELLPAYKNRLEQGESTESKSSQECSKADIGLCPECPDCGGLLEFAEGCVLCPSCGYSKCS